MIKALFLVAMLSLSLPQSSVGSVDGVWIAEFDGRTFIRLELHTVSGTTRGGMSLGHFEVDEQGAVRRAEEAPNDLAPIINFAKRGSVLTFSRKGVGKPEPFEVRLIDANAAELRVILSDSDRKAFAEEGIPMPKTIRLKRQ